MRRACGLLRCSACTTVFVPIVSFDKHLAVAHIWAPLRCAVASDRKPAQYHGIGPVIRSRQFGELTLTDITADGRLAVAAVTPQGPLFCALLCYLPILPHGTAVSTNPSRTIHTSWRARRLHTVYGPSRWLSVGLRRWLVTVPCTSPSHEPTVHHPNPYPSLAPNPSTRQHIQSITRPPTCSAQHHLPPTLTCLPLHCACTCCCCCRGVNYFADSGRRCLEYMPGITLHPSLS